MPTRIEDLLDLDSLLTPEDIELRQTVRRFGEQRLRPHVADWFEAGEVPVRELAADLGKLGVLGMHLKGYGCGGPTEPDFGSNPAGMRTTARRDGSDWILYGSKMWITTGSVADVAIVWARSTEGIIGFVVPAGTPGFSA